LFAWPCAKLVVDPADFPKDSIDPSVSYRRSKNVPCFRLGKSDRFNHASAISYFTDPGQDWNSNEEGMLSLLVTVKEGF